MIRVKNIKLSYGDLNVLKGIDLDINQGDFISIVGDSGAGKTTLLNILGTLEKPDSGNVYINDEEVYKMKDKQLSKFRNEKIGFVFQFHNLLTEFSALENICIPAFIKGCNKKDAEEKGRALLDLLDLSNREKHKPNELSGGEQQRVAVARALINKPSIVIADEPSGNLDSENSTQLHNLLVNLNEDLNQTFIIATHDKDLAKMAKKKLEIKDGKII